MWPKGSIDAGEGLACVQGGEREFDVGSWVFVSSMATALERDNRLHLQ